MEFRIIPEKKNLKTRLSEMLAGILSVFCDKPVTMATIIIVAVIYAVDETFSFGTDNAVKDALFYISPFLASFAFHALFAEEYFADKLYRMIGFGVGAAVSGAIVYTMSFDTEKNIFGMRWELFEEYEAQFFMTYFGLLAIYSLYHMYRKSGLTLERYCIDTFCALVRSSVVYGLFAGGIAVIIYIFEELICELPHAMSLVQIFLLAGLFVPSVILALSRQKESYGKFARLVLMYVLEPMMILTYIIIYVYILKIIISAEMPSNSVFNILAFVFSVAMPVWTMLHGIDEDSIIIKISKYLPLIFIPFLILQIICIGMRVAEYGITQERYLAITLVLCEIIYMGLYIYQFVKKQPMIAYLFHVLAVCLVCVFWIPAINMTDAIVLSQSSRIKPLLAIENPTELQKHQLYSAYRSCIYVNDISEEKIKKIFSESEIKRLEAYSDYEYYRENEEYTNKTSYISASRTLDNLDVSGYKTMKFVTSNYSNGIDAIEPEHYGFVVGKDSAAASISAEFVDLDVSWIVDYFMEHADNEYEALNELEVVEVGEHQYLYVTSISIEYYTVSREYESIRISGYLFE